MVVFVIALKSSEFACIRMIVFEYVTFSTYNPTISSQLARFCIYLDRDEHNANFLTKFSHLTPSSNPKLEVQKVDIT